MTTVATSTLPTADGLRSQVRDALNAVGSRPELGAPGGHGLQASTPITGDVLFTVAETTPEQADAAIAEAAQAFTTWRTTPAPIRGALVARLGELLVEHKADLATLVTIEAGKRIDAEPHVGRGVVQDAVPANAGIENTDLSVSVPGE